jgi:hypothetical protein
MWQITALFICCLFPSLGCLLGVWWSGSFDGVIAGTVLGGLIGMTAAIGLLA